MQDPQDAVAVAANPYCCLDRTIRVLLPTAEDVQTADSLSNFVLSQLNDVRNANQRRGEDPHQSKKNKVEAITNEWPNVVAIDWSQAFGGWEPECVGLHKHLPCLYIFVQPKNTRNAPARFRKEKPLVHACFGVYRGINTLDEHSCSVFGHAPRKMARGKRYNPEAISRELPITLPNGRDNQQNPDILYIQERLKQISNCLGRHFENRRSCSRFPSHHLSRAGNEIRCNCRRVHEDGLDPNHTVPLALYERNPDDDKDKSDVSTMDDDSGGSRDSSSKRLKPSDDSANTSSPDPEFDVPPTTSGSKDNDAILSPDSEFDALMEFLEQFQPHPLEFHRHTDGASAEQVASSSPSAEVPCACPEHEVQGKEAKQEDEEGPNTFTGFRSSLPDEIKQNTMQSLRRILERNMPATTESISSSEAFNVILTSPCLGVFGQRGSESQRVQGIRKIIVVELFGGEDRVLSLNYRTLYAKWFFACLHIMDSGLRAETSTTNFDAWLQNYLPFPEVFREVRVTFKPKSVADSAEIRLRCRWPGGPSMFDVYEGSLNNGKEILNKAMVNSEGDLEDSREVLKDAEFHIEIQSNELDLTFIVVNGDDEEWKDVFFHSALATIRLTNESPGKIEVFGDPFRKMIWIPFVIHDSDCTDDRLSEINEEIRKSAENDFAMARNQDGGSNDDKLNRRWLKNEWLSSNFSVHAVSAKRGLQRLLQGEMPSDWKTLREKMNALQALIWERSNFAQPIIAESLLINLTCILDAERKLRGEGDTNKKDSLEKLLRIRFGAIESTLKTIPPNATEQYFTKRQVLRLVGHYDIEVRRALVEQCKLRPEYVGETANYLVGPEDVRALLDLAKRYVREITTSSVGSIMEPYLDKIGRGDFADMDVYERERGKLIQAVVVLAKSLWPDEYAAAFTN